MTENCIFCKIIKGEIPTVKVYEDEDFIAMLDRFPASKGHILIIPKKHAKDFYDLDVKVAGQLFELASKLAPKIKKAFNNEGLNIIQNNGEIAGQTVFHYHLHLIPRYKDDKVDLKWVSNQEITVEELEKDKKLLKNEF